MKYFIAAILLISIGLNFYFVPRFLKLNVNMEKLSFQIVDYSKEIQEKLTSLNQLCDERKTMLEHCIEDKKSDRTYLISQFAGILEGLIVCESRGIKVQRCIDKWKE